MSNHHDAMIDLIGAAAEPFGLHYPMSWCAMGTRRDQALRRLAAVNEPPRPADERVVEIEQSHALWCDSVWCYCDIPF